MECDEGDTVRFKAVLTGDPNPEVSHSSRPISFSLFAVFTDRCHTRWMSFSIFRSHGWSTGFRFQNPTRLNLLAKTAFALLQYRTFRVILMEWSRARCVIFLFGELILISLMHKTETILDLASCFY